jgi:hypothetical protein
MTERAPWFQDGLRFECTQCGNCCTGAPGVVWVTEEEVAKIADVLGQSLELVKKNHTRRVESRVSLTERKNGDCTFFDSETRRCTVYAARPAQCKTWPFWNSNLEDAESWKTMQEGCPGAGHGPLYSLQQIQRKSRVIDV